MTVLEERIGPKNQTKEQDGSIGRKNRAAVLYERIIGRQYWTKELNESIGRKNRTKELEEKIERKDVDESKH